MPRLTPEELALILTGTRAEREGLEALELIVTVRKPEEVEALVKQNIALRERVAALEDELNRKRLDKVEAVHYGQLLARARRELKKNGLPFDWIK